MEEKKSRRPGLQTTVRRIPSEAVKTTKNNRASQTSKKRTAQGNHRRKSKGFSDGKNWTQNLIKAGKILTKSSPENQTERRQKRVYTQRLIILAIMAVFVIFLGSCFYHVFHFQNKTTVNGVNVSGLSVKGAARKMEQQSKNYSLKITADGNVEEDLIDSALHVKVTDTAGLKKALRKQNPFTWMTGGLHKKKYTANIGASYDENRLKDDISALSILQSGNMIKPVDASLSKTGDGQYEIRKETIGSTFDVNAAASLISAAVGNYQRAVNISAAQAHPQVYSTSENLITRMNQWNGYLRSAGISYNFPAKTVSLSAKEISNLLSDDGKTVTVSYAKVADLMANWRETYDTYNNSFHFKTESGKTIKTWYEGDYGFELNEEGTAKDLIANIKAGDNSNHDPKWYHKGNSMENMGLGDTYVEVSLDDQHLWVHKNGEIVVDTDVVTGNPNPDEKGRNRETYKGCYAIKGKYKKVTLGSLDVQGYASPVNYWVPFNGGEGLHDAPWRDEFGGSIYLNNGSHGCVNCPEDIMGKIYANVEKGEAVIIY